MLLCAGTAVHVICRLPNHCRGWSKPLALGSPSTLPSLEATVLLISVVKGLPASLQAEMLSQEPMGKLPWGKCANR